jgi:hypothetical protein
MPDGEESHLSTTATNGSEGISSHSPLLTVKILFCKEAGASSLLLAGI